MAYRGGLVGAQERPGRPIPRKTLDKFLASVDSELWALLSAREQQAASLHVGIIDGGPPRWLSKCGYVKAIFQALDHRLHFTSASRPLAFWSGFVAFDPTYYVNLQRVSSLSFSFFLLSLFSGFFLLFFIPIASRNVPELPRRSLHTLLTLGCFSLGDSMVYKEDPLRERTWPIPSY